MVDASTARAAFRHTAAISAIRAGMGLFEVQLMLGHTDLTMVRHYAKLAGEDLARASQQHSALDHLKLNL
jgi:integrase/recombinase XerD